MVHKVQSIEMAEGQIVQVETNSLPHSFTGGTYDSLQTNVDQKNLAGKRSTVSHAQQTSFSKAKSNAVKPYSLEDAFVEDDTKGVAPQIVDEDVDDRDDNLTGIHSQGGQWSKIPPPSVSAIGNTLTIE